MKALNDFERIQRLKNRWAFNYAAYYERIKNLENKWVLNYNPWHDELGRFTFAGTGTTFVLPSTAISFNPSQCLQRVGKNDVRFDYSKFPAYRPDKAAVAITNKYQNGLSSEINRALREIRQCSKFSDALKILDSKFVDLQYKTSLARVPGESGNYLYTSAAIRNLSRTINFSNTEEMTLYRGISGDHFNRATKGSTYVLNDFTSSSTSATVATDFAGRRASQDGTKVATVYRINAPAGTPMAIPDYTKISAGMRADNNESEVLLAPSTVVRVDKVGNLKNVKMADGNTQRVREVTLTILPREKAADELAAGDYSRYEKDE